MYVLWGGEGLHSAGSPDSHSVAVRLQKSSYEPFFRCHHMGHVTHIVAVRLQGHMGKVRGRTWQQLLAILLGSRWLIRLSLFTSTSRSNKTKKNSSHSFFSFFRAWGKALQNLKRCNLIEINTLTRDNRRFCCIDEMKKYLMVWCSQKKKARTKKIQHANVTYSPKAAHRHNVIWSLRAMKKFSPLFFIL